MSVNSQLRESTRQRAEFKCEFCGVSEVDSGGKLTIDHFDPVSRGGLDEFNNLVYCCIRCNTFKHNYIPVLPSDVPLYNPRIDQYSDHFLTLPDGTIQGLSKIGSFTIKRLRLNRKLLVLYRLKQQRFLVGIQQQEELQKVLMLQAELQKKLFEFYNKNKDLKKEQQRYLKMILDMFERKE